MVNCGNLLMIKSDSQTNWYFALQPRSLSPRLLNTLTQVWPWSTSMYCNEWHRVTQYANGTNMYIYICVCVCVSLRERVSSLLPNFYPFNITVLWPLFYVHFCVTIFIRQCKKPQTPICLLHSARILQIDQKADELCCCLVLSHWRLIAYKTTQHLSPSYQSKPRRCRWKG